jgi:hypothetical protein
MATMPEMKVKVEFEDGGECAIYSKFLLDWLESCGESGVPVEPLVRELLSYINETPPLLSLLYDLDWMPEQLERGEHDWFRILMLAEAWKANMPNSAGQPRAVASRAEPACSASDCPSKKKLKKVDPRG